MSFATALLTPLVLLLPAAGAVEANQDVPVETVVAQQEMQISVRNVREARNVAPEDLRVQTFQGWPMQFVSHGFRPESAFQVRIERRMTIRIAPHPKPVRPNSLVGVPTRPIGPRYVERKIGKCLPVARISGVQSNGGKNLLLFMRDRRIVSARLERACRARDFYSGFYLSRSNDGKLCVDRDALQSRSGRELQVDPHSPARSAGRLSDRFEAGAQSMAPNCTGRFLTFAAILAIGGAMSWARRAHPARVGPLHRPQTDFRNFREAYEICRSRPV